MWRQRSEKMFRNVKNNYFTKKSSWIDVVDVGGGEELTGNIKTIFPPPTTNFTTTKKVDSNQILANKREVLVSRYYNWATSVRCASGIVVYKHYINKR
jgi:hypothetical protein